LEEFVFASDLMRQIRQSPLGRNTDLTA